jgi:hypothetical protein
MHHRLARLDGKMCGVIQLPTRASRSMEDDSTDAAGHGTSTVLIPN